MLDQLTEDIEKTGFCIFPDFLNPSETLLLSEDMDRLTKENLFKQASIGKGSQIKSDPNIRQDRIFWLDPAIQSLSPTFLWDKLETLRLAINQALYLGLWSFEGHYAIYPPGAFYKKHLDCFKDDDARVVSVILYLNSEWTQEDGGHLRIHSRAGQTFSSQHSEFLDIAPTGGTLACFLSHSVEHEVRVSRKLRKSFTGWFRKKPLLLHTT